MIVYRIVQILILLQLADLVTTYLAIRAGGYETNPRLIELAGFLKRFTNAKWAWLLLAKLGAAIALDGIYQAGWMTGEYDIVALYIAAVIYLAIILNNLGVWRRLRQH